MNRQLLIIDAQNDFCRPEGSLFVKGAEKDTATIAVIIRDPKSNLVAVDTTGDAHEDSSVKPFTASHIGSPNAWHPKPAPFSKITLAEVTAGKYRPANLHDEAFFQTYIESQGEVSIWPVHCVPGTWGQQLTDDIALAISAWQFATGGTYRVHRKGINRRTEQYSAIHAIFPQLFDKSTQMNEQLIYNLLNGNEIGICGEAADVCVSSTVRSLMEYLPALMRFEDFGGFSRFTVLTDTTSCVTGVPEIWETFVKDASTVGIKFQTSAEWLSS